MFRDEYDELRRSLDGTGGRRCDTRLHVVTGKRKRQTGRLVHCGFDAGALVIEFDDGEKVATHYGACHYVEADGTVRLSKLRDMTGREIVLGSYLCYAVSVGARSFGLEFGTVQKISSTGTMTVRPMLRNGKRVNFTARHRSTISGYRALLLPLDDEQITIAMLTDFANFGEGSLHG